MGSIDRHASDLGSPSTIYTIDELIRELGSDADQTPLIAFPKTELGIDDYEFFNGRDTNRLVDGAVSQLLAGILTPASEENVIGIVSQSDLDFIINLFAVGRLGYTSLILSPRLDNVACEGLLQRLGAKVLLYGPGFAQKAAYVREHSSLPTSPMVLRKDYETADISVLSRPSLDDDGPSQTVKNCIIMHSSGSTGQPRPIFYPHKRLLHVMINAQNLIAFLSVPLFHAHGFVSFLQALYKRKTVYLFNGNLPQTHESVTSAIRAAQPEIIWTVPYVLKLLAEKQDGIDVLKPCKIVSCSGSRCPDELGDLVVSQGVHLGTSFGATEVAFVFSNLNRPRTDRYWDYMSAPPHVAPFVHMKPIEGNVFELVVLEGHKGKITSNSNDPPDSFHTKDLFIPHPQLKHRWKYVGRHDDRITLSNGEKFIPLDIEGRVRQSPLVKEAVVFGVDRPLPGLLLFRSDTAPDLSNDQIVDILWPDISEANTKVSAFGQIGREYIVVLPASTDCPITDKQSVKRAQVYRQFANVIDSVYRDEPGGIGSLQLNQNELTNWLMEKFKTELNVILDNKDTDFFAAGVDSQKAIQMRRTILQSLDLGDPTSKLNSLVVFEYGNVARLAAFLNFLRTNESIGQQDDLKLAKEMIEEHSIFHNFIPNVENTDHAVVLLTGATGTLGSAILEELLAEPSTQIYCPVRARSGAEASSRLLSALSKTGHIVDSHLSSNIHAFACDLSSSPLSIPSDMLDHFTTHLTHIIHAAWPVNFSLGLSSFTPHIANLSYLYSLTLSVKSPTPARFLFCSSVGTAMSSPRGTIVPDAPIPDLAFAAPTGYARSKLVGEHILERAHSLNHNATILRIGQIIPSTYPAASKLWNTSETIPLVVQSALTTHSLPATPGPRAGDQCSWIPVNMLARTILDLAGGSLATTTTSTTTLTNEPQGSDNLFYNLVNPHPFSWSRSFLPLLCQTQTQALDFEILPFETWFSKLSAQTATPAPPPVATGEVDSASENNNPAVKLVDIWSRSPQRQEQRDESVGGGAVEGEGGGGGVRFETAAAMRDSVSFRTADWDVCTQGYVGELVQAWMSVWGKK